ncbi:ComF family protein [Azonexus sp.]|uniref:ComF family protein n=1 Tax=Azonexus sp. TaxID=1872668 RepID=UPI0027B96B71|nr:ComF family protein [Azonexus sp.]
MSILPQPADLQAHRQNSRPAWLPGSCLLCLADTGTELLCPACQTDLPGQPEYTCPQCGTSTTHGERCGSCLVQPPHFAGITTLFRYDFPVDRMIHALKYGHQLVLAEWFATRLAEKLRAHVFDRIIPLPLHPQRLCQRGFNQSAEIARTLEKCLHIPVDRKSLQRRNATLPQASLPLKERYSNVRGAFECQEDLSGLRVLLIDDVMTTGATANECSRILALHGAQLIHVGIVARAQKA